MSLTQSVHRRLGGRFVCFLMATAMLLGIVGSVFYLESFSIVDQFQVLFSNETSKQDRVAFLDRRSSPSFGLLTGIAIFVLSSIGLSCIIGRKMTSLTGIQPPINRIDVLIVSGGTLIAFGFAILFYTNAVWGSYERIGYLFFASLVGVVLLVIGLLVAVYTVKR